MANWNRTIKLGDVWKGYRDGLLDIEQVAERVAARIEKSGWYDDTPYPDTLRDHVNALKGAFSVGEYDFLFSRVYDVADEDLVWIETD